MAQYLWANCPDEPRGQVNRFTDEARRVFGDNLVGVYLHGSLAMGCFNPDRSDIDLLIVSQSGLSAADQRDLAVLSLQTSARPCPLEFSVVRRAAWVYPTPFEFHYSEDWRARMEMELANDTWRWWTGAPADPDLAAHMTMIRHRGICLVGAPIVSAIPEVPRADYVDSILRDFDWARERMADNAIYAVLNFCRVYGYLLNGQIGSKDEAGDWALLHLPDVYHSLVRQALDIYRGRTSDSPLRVDLLPDFAAFIYDKVRALA